MVQLTHLIGDDMATVIPYATPQQAAQIAVELIDRWRANQLMTDVALLVAQGHGLGGCGLGLAFGQPGGVTPIGARAADEQLTEGDAYARIVIVAQNGMPSTGTPSWLTVAVRLFLNKILADVPEPLRTTLAALLDKWL